MNTTKEELTLVIANAKKLPQHPAMTEAISLAEDMLANPSRQNRQLLLDLGRQNTMQADENATHAVHHTLYGETLEALTSISKTAAHASAAALAYMASTLEISG